MDKIVYIVQLNIEKAASAGFYYSTCGPRFLAQLVNQTATNLYFIKKGTEELIIIPHEWIEWLAPARPIEEEVNEENKKEEEVNEEQ